MSLNTTSINDRLGPGGLENVATLATDANGNVTGLVDPAGGISMLGSSTVSSITYNSDGTVATYVKNGVTHTVSYNANGYVSSIVQTGGVTITPSYDSNFRVTSMTVA